jgi:hypothetical protein
MLLAASHWGDEAKLAVFLGIYGPQEGRDVPVVRLPRLIIHLLTPWSIPEVSGR